MKRPHVIDATYEVVDEKLRREPIISSWWGFVALGGALAANYFVRYGLWQVLHKWPIHIQLSDLLGRH
jgi:hypothetical protein